MSYLIISISSHCNTTHKTKIMFGLFKKKSEEELLHKKYKELMKDAFVLSTTNRKESDLNYAKADHNETNGTNQKN